VDVHALAISVLVLPRRQTTYVFVLEGSVRAFPSCDATTTVAERHEAGLNPCRAEAVEEIGLASDLILMEIGVAQLPNIYLVGGGKWLSLVDGCIHCYLPCPGRSKSHNSKTLYSHSSRRRQAPVLTHSS